MNKAEECGKLFKKLADRIYKHRRNCKGWNKGKPCFDCHYNTLTPLKEVMEDIWLLYPKEQ